MFIYSGTSSVYVAMPKDEPDKPLRSISKQSKLVKRKSKHDMISNAFIKEGIAAETGLDLDTTKDDDKDNTKDETMEHTSAFEDDDDYQPTQSYLVALLLLQMIRLLFYLGILALMKI